MNEHDTNTPDPNGASPEAAIDAPSAVPAAPATGTIAGQYPKSAWKIAFIVLLALIAIVIFSVLSQQQ